MHLDFDLTRKRTTAADLAGARQQVTLLGLGDYDTRFARKDISNGTML